MMEETRLRTLYFILVPAILIAAGILGYYTFRSARDHAQLGERTIAQSLLSVAQERVGRIERYIVDEDNAVARLVDSNDPGSIEAAWLPQAENVSPSVVSVLLIDGAGEIKAWASRADRRQRKRFLKAFSEELFPALGLVELQTHDLKHLHRSVGNSSYLLSYRAQPTLGGEPMYVIAHHDVDFLAEQVLPSMFPEDESGLLYNVINERNEHVFGPDLSEAGVYMVGYKFPATLYLWRLQVAPHQAALLEAQGRSRLAAEVSLPITSFAIILLSAIFFIYAAAKERHLNQLKSELMANVSHELKTPLSVVRMFGEMLRDDRIFDDDRRHEYLNIICRESERLTSLIDNVLDFSALERGKGPYHLRREDLRPAVERALEAFRYRSEQDGVEISVEVKEDLPAVLIDQEAIALAVINLLDNALKYGGRTPVELSLASTGASIEVAVRDHGPGIPKDAMRRVFERFYRGAHETDTRGSGIGLSLVKQIAQAHGGHAWARNAKDGGAVVGFSLPVAPPGSYGGAHV